MAHNVKKAYFIDTHFRALIEKSHDVIVLLDAKGKLLYASPSIVRLYGRKMSEITGVSSFKYIYPTDIPKVVNAIKNLLLHPDQPTTIQLRIKHLNGSWKWIEAVGTNFMKDPEVGAIVVNFHDITEFKELEERKDNFISIASHELKTPMTVIKSYAELLRRRFTKSEDKDALHLITKLDEQVDRLSTLVKELLDVTALEKGAIPLRKDRFHVEVLVKEIVEQEHFAHPEVMITLRLAKLPPVTADRFKLSQVIYNLVSNAIKYSPENKEIIVSVKKRQDTVRIEIADQGKGIKKEDIPHIFDRFYRGEHTSSASGLGLGLYISQEIVRQHGGEISVASELGKGSTFIVSLPLHHKQAKFIDKE